MHCKKFTVFHGISLILLQITMYCETIYCRCRRHLRKSGISGNAQAIPEMPAFSSIAQAFAIVRCFFLIIMVSFSLIAFRFQIGFCRLQFFIQGKTGCVEQLQKYLILNINPPVPFLTLKTTCSPVSRSGLVDSVFVQFGWAPWWL